MSTTQIETPTCQCQLGIGQSEITPPVGIYHRFWGAAKHDQATGVHRPLLASVVIMQPLELQDGAGHLLIALDHCLLRPDEMAAVLTATAERLDVSESQIVFTFSHTHSGGNLGRNRSSLPGGDLIGPYLDALPDRIETAYKLAKTSLQPVTLTFGLATCDMGQHRDYHDDERDQWVCGFNPDEKMSLPVSVIRAVDARDKIVGTIVNYACHPTTLAWDNTEISPDYVGALRNVVADETAAPCVFLLGACGDIGPKYGFVGDTSVADRNGRQVGHSALSALNSMPAALHDYHYAGPVISGATIGNWVVQPLSDLHDRQSRVFRHYRGSVQVPKLPDLPTVHSVEVDLERLLEQEQESRRSGDQEEPARLRALAERKRRLLEQIRPLPEGESYPLQYWLWQLGDIFVVAVEGEPYHFIQQELTRRFPDKSIMLIVLANGSRCVYLPTREAYEKSLYQVGVALLAAGCLEQLTDAVAAQLSEWS